MFEITNILLGPILGMLLIGAAFNVLLGAVWILRWIFCAGTLSIAHWYEDETPRLTPHL